MIDAHTHLNSPALFSNRKEYLLEFEKKWGTGLINVWADDDYNKNALVINREYNGDCFVKCTIWFSPHEILAGKIEYDNMDNKIKELKNLYLENKNHVVALWEIGIDTHFDDWVSLELQKKLFKKQCDLANELKLPLVIHSRDDFDSTMEVLQNYQDLKIYFHCRGYGPEEIKKLQYSQLKNYWIWFCGNITYPKAQNIKESLMMCDIKNILLETDAPYLSPQNLRWKTNYPANITYIYDFVAKMIGVSKDELIEKINNNFKTLYQN